MEYKVPSSVSNFAMKSEVFDVARSSDILVSKNSQKLYEIGTRLNEARSYHLDSRFFYEEESVGAANALVKKLFNRPLSKLRNLDVNELIRRESVIGGTLFGAVKKHEHRVFFNEDVKNWYYYQSILDPITGDEQSVTFHYEVYPEAILRVSSREDTPNMFIDGEELKNFMLAAELYHDKVMKHIYKRDYQNKNAA